MKDTVFFNLIPYRQQLQASMGQDAFHQHMIATQQALNVLFNWRSLFYAEQHHNQQHWRWSGKTAKLEIFNNSPKPLQLTLDFSLQTGYEQPAHISIHGGPFDESFLVSNIPVPIHKTFLLPPGKVTLYFKTDAKSAGIEVDQKERYFRVNNFRSTIQD